MVYVPCVWWLAILTTGRVLQVLESTLLLLIPTAKITFLETTTPTDSHLPTNSPPASKKPELQRNYFHRQFRAHRPPNCYKMNSFGSSLIAARVQVGACKHI